MCNIKSEVNKANRQYILNAITMENIDEQMD